jgi:tetrahydromethanopterin S-methyltransferase subunit B
VRWQNGKPTSALDGKFASLFWKIMFGVMMVLAALLLFAYWLLR